MARIKKRDDPFTNIAWKNLGSQKDITDRLMQELEIHIKSKKGIDDLVERIQKVTGASAAKAKTIATTEMNDYRNAARNEAILNENRGRKSGKATEKEWVHTHLAKRPRENHILISGQKRYASECFVLPNGVKILYPGDSSAPASERINCRCYIRRFVQG